MNRQLLIVAIVGAGLLIPVAYAEKQPRMEHALHALENARAQLEKAEHDKGGHRIKAIELIDSGGLIGAGHPVGATGTRQVLDAWKQVSD